MDSETLALISIIRLQTDVVTIRVQRIRNRRSQTRQLQQVILRIGNHTHMMRIAVPIE